MTHRLRTAVLVLLALVAPAMGAEPGPPQGGWDFNAWKLDQVSLRSGNVLHGLIESETEKQVRLLELRRPEGRGPFGVSRPLKRTEIAEIRRIDPQQRQETREQFDQYVNRGRVNAVRGEELLLEAFKESGAAGWRYRGTWYTMESRASKELTQRLVFRLEQMFTAYRRLLPPRLTQRAELKIMIFGASADYHALARSLGAPLENAAFYHPQRNLVAAGSDLARLAAQLEQVQAQHTALRTELDRLRRELPDRLEQRRQKLATTTAKDSEKRKLLATFGLQMKQEISTREHKLEEYDRQNEAVVQQHAGRLLALLHHEAFHAYLENYVYPQADFDVPRWLNEGLAQVFEKGVLEADTLRVDIADKATLALLTADLATNPAALAKILAADHRSFLMAHNGDRGKQTNYAYAWGLAYYLTFVNPVLGGQAMDQYVSREAASQDPLPRFGRLIDQPFPEFEAQWREWVLQKPLKR